MDSGAFLEELRTPRFQQDVNLSPELIGSLCSSLQTSGMALALFDPDDRLAFAGHIFAGIYNVPPGRPTFDEIIRHSYATRTGPVFETRDIEAWLQAANLKRRSQPRRHFEVDLLDGRWLLATETTFNGGWLLLGLTDITVLKASERTLRHARDAALKAAETDFLTGLYNRRRMMMTLADATERCQQSGDPLTLALIDLDHFKAINDAHGHTVGDKVLCHFAKRARASIRKADMLGRVGGEEFLVVMPGTVDEAFRTVDRLRVRVAQSKPLRGVDLRYTICAGLTALRCGDTADDLYHRADQALYAAKRSGRNRVRMSAAPIVAARSA